MYAHARNTNMNKILPPELALAVQGHQPFDDVDPFVVFVVVLVLLEFVSRHARPGYLPGKEGRGQRERKRKMW